MASHLNTANSCCHHAVSYTHLDVYKRQVIIHPVAVEIPTPLSHIIVADLDEILGGIYVTEVTESLVVQVLEALAACIIRMPVPNIASKREEDDITRTGQRFDFICPFIGIFTEFIHGDRTHVAVSPAVGGNFKTCLLYTSRALIGGLLVSLCASLLGVSLVLKRYSMIGDGLSHVSFGSLSIALAAGWSPLKVSIPVVVLAAFFLLRITEHGKVKSDAAIAMISASALAIGIIVTSLTTGMTTDVSSYMFGSILAMSREDVQFAAVLSMVVLGLYLFCYNKVFAVTFDESFAKAVSYTHLADGADLQLSGAE